MSEGTARNKLPLAAGVSIPQVRQAPPMHHRGPSSVKGAPAGRLAIKPDDDKTTAYKVPEELLRRARTGLVPALTEDEKSPDSGAITAPPPVETAAHESRVAPRAPGVPQDLLMSLLRAEHNDDEEVTILRPSVTHMTDDLDETDEPSGWNNDGGAEFPLVSRTIEAVGRAPAAANDAARRGLEVHPHRLKPGVAPLVLWLVVASITAAATALVWLVR